DSTVAEGNSGTTNAIVAVTLSNQSGDVVSVNWATVDGTATSPSDYLAASGTLTFAPGVTTQWITNKINGDLLNEADETFQIVLSGASNATLTKAEGIVTIANDDALPALSIDNVSILEGNNGTISVIQQVTLSAPSGQNVSVKWQTADDTATAPTDYLTA